MLLLFNSPIPVPQSQSKHDIDALTMHQKSTVKYATHFNITTRISLSKDLDCKDSLNVFEV